MKINYYKAFKALAEGEKIPRKNKKAVLGLKMSQSKLRRLLKSVQIIKSCDTMFDRPVIHPYTFCPKCGCKLYYGSGNMTSYPEHWEEFNCLRCHKLVGYIDNSPFYHALQFPNYNYDPSF